MARPTKQERIHRATYDAEATIPPTPPADLSPTAKAEFERVVALSKPGVLTPLDQTVIAQYAILAARLRAAPDDFRAAEHTQLRLLAAELGLTPASRAKTPQPEPKKENPWAAFG